jgi:hypothetical protein
MYRLLLLFRQLTHIQYANRLFREHEPKISSFRQQLFAKNTVWYGTRKSSAREKVDARTCNKKLTVLSSIN